MSADRLALEQVGPGGRHVEAADEVHQRRLARPRRPHDGDVLVAADVQRDAAQRVHRLAAQVVGLDDVAEREGRCRWPAGRLASASHRSPPPARACLVVDLDDRAVLEVPGDGAVAAGDDLVALREPLEDLDERRRSGCRS